MNIVRYYRDITRYTTPKVAEKMGLALSTVNKLVNGKTPIILEHETKIKELLVEYIKDEKEKAKEINIYLREIG